MLVGAVWSAYRTPTSGGAFRKLAQEVQHVTTTCRLLHNKEGQDVPLVEVTTTLAERGIREWEKFERCCLADASAHRRC